MIFKTKKHSSDLYSTLLVLSRNIFFYKTLKLADNFETRIYLMFFHFSIILTIFKDIKKKFKQNNYDSLFNNIENNLRELGFGDVSVNKKMKEMNKIFYDILLKHQINKLNTDKINEKLVLKYFPDLNNAKTQEFKYFETYFIKFYQFCFELSPDNMIREAIKFKL
jgi:cytochrome b pre-mRNA-processing protein 3